MPLVDRLMMHVRVVESGCWEFQLAPGKLGYGTITIDGTTRSAHRLSYTLHVGPIPAGLQLDHLCRSRICVNPAHLEPVTPKENIRRARAAA